MSKNNVIQTTARAALSQTSSTLFQRMENTQKLIDEKKDLNENNILSNIENPEVKRIQEIEPIIKNYMNNVLINTIDNVCMYEEKIKTIENRFQELLDKKEIDEKKRDEDKKKEIDLIPLRSVPLICDTDDLKYKKIVSVNIENENSVISGKFGWCFVCRKTANVYCKETRVPVCNAECKKKHLEELG